MAKLMQRVNPWMFAIGLFLAIGGAEISATNLLGDPSTGGAHLPVGPLMVFVGAILMSVSYATLRS